MYKQPLIITIILALFAGISEAEIINVPDDHETIQAGIDATEEGDTVLVQPGTYEENLQINDHFITLASLTLMTGDPAYIDSTIIDGRQQATVVNIGELEGTVILRGFIIQNGDGQHGGGINVANSNLLIEDMIIRDNTGRTGGGVACTGENTIIIRRTVVENNRCNYVGGLGLRENKVTLEDVIFRENFGRHVGVSKVFGSLNMRNVAMLNNEGEYPGMEIAGIHSEEDMIWENVTIAGQINLIPYNIPCIRGSIEGDSRLVLRNCLIYGNENDGVSIGGTFNISYSLIAGGRDAVVGRDLDWGEGNIDEDPLFADPDNGNYQLTEESPCIDAGDPESDLDPDGSRADIGAFSFQQGGVIEGIVFDFRTEQPLEGALVTTSFGSVSMTDEAGYWSFSSTIFGLFSLTASFSEFIDSTMTDLQVDLEDTLSITFNLLHAELQPSVEGIAAEIEIGEEELFNFSITNPGNGVLDWSVETQYRGDEFHEPWELRRIHQFGQQLEDAGLYGVAFIDSQFYVSGANDGSPTIYILDKEGGLIDTFAQPGDHRLGTKDLAFDGELLWGVVGDTTYGITLEGEVMYSFEAPGRTPSLITWDSDREILWIGGTTENIFGMDRDGNLVEGMEISRDGLRMYGLAYFPDDPDDAPLYLLHREDDTNRQTLHKHNFETNENIFVTYLEHEAGGRPQGSFITDQFDNYSWTFISVTNDAGQDRVDVWQLYANTSWMILDPIEGALNPAAEQEITLIIDASDLDPIEYPAELVFRHNGRGLETIIPIDLTVTSLGVENYKEIQPQKFEITGVFPNPFNSTVRLSFTIPQSAEISIKLYDVTGSLVDNLISNLHQSGQHDVIWDASSMPSGIYFARMETGAFSHTAKLMLMR